MNSADMFTLYLFSSTHIHIYIIFIFVEMENKNEQQNMETLSVFADYVACV